MSGEKFGKLGVVVALALFAFACGPKRFDPVSGQWTRHPAKTIEEAARDPAPAQRVSASAAVAINAGSPHAHPSKGQRAFEFFCAKCHPNGNGIDKPQDRNSVARRVRAGSKKMPAIPPRKLSDPNLGLLADYVVQMQRANVVARQ